MAKKTHIDRRGLLRGDWLRPATPGPSYTLRPPGALAERVFPVACTACGACAAACPHNIIFMTGPPQIDAQATPELFVDVAPCRLCEDLPCIAACEPRALRQTARADVRIARATVLTKKCWVTNGTDEACDKCVVACPLTPDAITQEPGRAPIIHSNACTGCGLCYGDCPVPGKAIQLSQL
ncbi:MAG: 4Fe-4S dicluster domain-containing protein [Proteobacteria bacterium]|nr:4Fe-4S dicluster domain-containing protein [Pseudomonadota bacterium]